MAGLFSSNLPRKSLLLEKIVKKKLHSETAIIFISFQVNELALNIIYNMYKVYIPYYYSFHKPYLREPHFGPLLPLLQKISFF